MDRSSQSPPDAHCLAAAILLDTLSLGFRYPDAGLFASLRDGRYADTLTAAWETLEPGTAAMPDVAALRTGISDCVARGHAALESDYVALFDANRRTAPLRLYAHLYSETHEPQVNLLRRLHARYHGAGVDIAQGAQAEQADHLCVQLDFLALLYQRRQAAMDASDSAASDRLAADIKDFLPELAWIAHFAAAVADRPAHNFYSPLTNLLTHALQRLAAI